MKNILKRIFTLGLLTFILIGCSQTASTTSLMESNISSIEENIMEKYSLDAITFNYPTGIDISESGNIVYVHFTGQSFVMIKNSLENYNASMTTELAQQYFDSALESFNAGDWSNASIVSPIEETTLSGTTAWRSVFSSDEATQGKCKIDTVVTIINGKIVSLSFISVDSQYDQYLSTFNTLLSTVKSN